MRKSSGHLTMGLLLLAVLVAMTFMIGRSLPTEANASTDLTDGQKLVYTVDSADAEIVAKAAEILEKRIYNFGADSVKTTVEGSTVTLIYNGINDNERLRKNLTRTGEISFRNSKDELLDSKGILADSMPLACAEAEKGSTVYFHVNDTEALKNLYTSMVVGQDTMLVIWVDYEEGQKYETESTKDNPAYLIAATMSSALDGDFYVTTNKAFADTYDAVRVVDGGVLPAKVTESGFEAVEAAYGANALNKVLNFLYAGLAIGGLYLIWKYKLTGLVNAVSLFAFATASLISISWLDVRFNVETVALLLTALLAAWTIMVYYDDRFAEDMRTGRNGRTAYAAVVKRMVKPVIAGAAFMLISGLTAYLFFSQLREYGTVIMVLAVCLVLFAVGANVIIMNHLLASNYFDKSLFGPQKQESEKIVSFRNTAWGLLAACLFGLVFYLINRSSDIAVIGKSLCCLAVGALGCALFNALDKKGYNTLPVCGGVLAAFMGGHLPLQGSYQSADYLGIALLIGALTFIYAMITLSELNDGYKELSRGKLSEEKITELGNTVQSRLGSVTASGLAGVIVISVAVYLLAIKAPSGILLAVAGASASAAAGSVVTGALWMRSFINRPSKPSGKKKQSRKNNELKETTVFGINEIR
ncbi:MAG: hypothetical protein J5694_00600 [Erysipelotrichaceae bacterium]|nr:hypothetical protein [Erysipelotrichaceae bacterium]